jgi:hypothetical protein
MKSPPKYKSFTITSNLESEGDGGFKGGKILITDVYS